MGDSALNLALKPQKAVAHFMGFKIFFPAVSQGLRPGLYTVAR